MTGPIMFCDVAPEVTERSGLFVIEIGSGSEKASYALPQRAILILAERAKETVTSATKAREDVVLPFPKPSRARKRRA